MDPTTNPCQICWEDREKGMFKLVQPRRIAYLWGMKKGNPNMTYEKFSRAMRFAILLIASGMTKGSK